MMKLRFSGYVEYILMLFKEGLWLKSISLFWGVVGVLIFIRDEIWMPKDENGWKFWTLIPHLSLSIWIAIFLLVLLIGMVQASKTVYVKTLDQMNRLKVIDRADLERLLNGYFVGDTFFYKAEIVLCANYVGKSLLMQLTETFTNITVRAPKNSWATIKFQFMNGHVSGKCDFYILDKSNRSTRIDIYHCPPIYLNETSSFAFKLVCDDSYVFNESASLQISVDAWKK